MKKDIENIEDIKLMVDIFYSKVQKNQLLADIFNNRIQNNWPKHLEKMYRFWETVLLDNHTYNGSPFLPHATMPINKEHFNCWIILFNETIEENFAGKIAEEAKWRAGKMAEMFHHKIEYYKNNPTKTAL